MRIRDGVKLDFDDVLIVPQRSSLSSRSEVDIYRTFKFKGIDWSWSGFPLILANMSATGTFAFAKALAKFKIMVALHKHYPVEQLVDFFVNNLDLWNYTFYTVGSSKEDEDKLDEVKKLISERTGGKSIFPMFVCIDIANGYSQNFVSVVANYRRKFPCSVIMAGNVISPNMTEELAMNGANIVKAGTGSGTVCRTRKQTGVGFPQLSACDECSFVAHGKPQGLVCSDGGCRSAGDVAKIFAVGGDFCMIGGMFAGCSECEGEWTEAPETIVENGIPKLTGKFVKKSLKFYGMSSKEAQDKYNGGLADYRTSEGACIDVPYKGAAEDVARDIMGGVRSCCTYVGAARLKDLPKCAEFVRIR